MALRKISQKAGLHINKLGISGRLSPKGGILGGIGLQSRPYWSGKTVAAAFTQLVGIPRYSYGCL